MSVFHAVKQRMCLFGDNGETQAPFVLWKLLTSIDNCPFFHRPRLKAGSSRISSSATPSRRTTAGHVKRSSPL